MTGRLFPGFCRQPILTLDVYTCRYHPAVQTGSGRAGHHGKRSLMRFFRILLLVVLFSAVAGVAATSAGALGFEDAPCPLTDPVNHQLKVCQPDAQQGKPYSLQIKGKGGCTPDFVTYEVVGGTLPPGLSVNSSTALVTGTPTKAGVFQFWLQVSDHPQSWCVDSKQSQWEFQITVDPGLNISPSAASLTAGQIGTPYSQQFTATGGTPTWSVSSGTLPAGLSLNTSTGLLSGTPTTTGDYTFAITATAGNATDTQHFTLSVVEPLKITSGAVAAGEIGQPFSMTLAATGGKSGYTWSLANDSSLPDGLTLDPKTGTITGNPTAASTDNVKVTVTDSLGLNTTIDLKIVVASKLAILKQALRVARVGHAYRAHLFAQGGLAPRSWSILHGSLPAGIHLNTRTGALTGTPTKAGRAHVTFEVVDKLGVVSKARFVLNVTS
jgi:large repetitive protein